MAARNPDPDRDGPKDMKRTKASQFLEDASTPRNQYAALCWRLHRGHVEVLLITSRDTGRWVTPKGWPMDGMDPAEAAAREAWEEAGVTGEVEPDVLGFYSYDKVLKPGQSLPCVVAVYPLRVGELADKFPERKERRRKWFSAAKAARKVAEPELRELLANLAEADGLLAVHPTGRDKHPVSEG
jgi:8-oxo-dGTP pyrophosphatase MutT (NUDIX family)